MDSKGHPTEVDRDQLALLKSLIKSSMFFEPDVNSGRLMDMMGFHVKPFTIGLEYGRRNVVLNMHFTSLQPLKK
jgi:hypothetical protein